MKYVNTSLSGKAEIGKALSKLNSLIGEQEKTDSKEFSNTVQFMQLNEFQAIRYTENGLTASANNHLM